MFMELVGNGKTVESKWVYCKNCSNRKSVAASINMPSEAWEKIRRVRHPANRWMVKAVEISNGWARFPYLDVTCSAGLPSTIQDDIPHWCHLYTDQSASAVGDTNGSENSNTGNWWE
jgi:hypothetical protein